MLDPWYAAMKRRCVDDGRVGVKTGAHPRGGGGGSAAAASTVLGPAAAATESDVVDGEQIARAVVPRSALM